MPTPRDLQAESLEKSYEFQDRMMQRAEHHVPSDAEVAETLELRARDILEQIGWNRTDTCFVSLNLTPEQFAAIQAADAKWSGTLEELLVEGARRMTG